METMDVIDVVTSIGVLGALVALIFEMRKTRLERIAARSEFAMREVIEAWSQAHELLSDGNNDRVTWILASRIIENAKKMKINVKEQSHIDVVEVAEVQYRNIMADLLGYGSDKPSNFYYGEGQSLAIPEAALFSIWNFAQFPDDYEDPLPSEKFPGDWVDSSVQAVQFPALHAYISHLRNRQSNDAD